LVNASINLNFYDQNLLSQKVKEAPTTYLFASRITYLPERLLC